MAALRRCQIFSRPDDHGCPATRPGVSETLEKLEAVDPGNDEIEDHCRRALFRGGAERACDILPAHGSVSQFSERFVRELQSRFVIIHHENRPPVAGLDPTAIERFQDFAWRHRLRQDIPDFVAHPDSLVGQNAYDDYRRSRLRPRSRIFPSTARPLISGSIMSSMIASKRVSRQCTRASAPVATVSTA